MRYRLFSVALAEHQSHSWPEKATFLPLMQKIEMEEDAVHEIHDGFDVEEEGMGVVHELEHEDDLVLEEGHDDDHIDAVSPDGKKKPKRKRRSAYAYFCAENRKHILEENPELSFGGCSHKLAQMWKALGEAERQPYEDKADEADKSTYSEPAGEGHHDEEQKRRGRKKRERKWTKDPSAPKKALTPYIVFGKSIREDVTAYLKEHNPNTKPTDILKEISVRWNKLSASEKAPFEIEASKDRARYQEEKKQWIEANPEHRTPAAKKAKLAEEPDRRVLKIRVRGQQDDLFDKVFINAPFNMKALHKKIQAKLENHAPILEIIHLPDHRVRDQDDLDSLTNEAVLEVVFDSPVMEVAQDE